MLPRRRIDINSIYVLVKKKEQGPFSFTNERRHHDGFVLVTRGNGVFKLYNSSGECVETPISRGSLMLFRKYDNYSIELDEPCEYITTAYDLEFKHYREANKIPRVMMVDDVMHNDIEEMLNIWQSRGWDSYIICKIKLLQFHLSIMQNLEKKAVSTDKYTAAAVDFIHKNFKRNFTADELSRHCAMSYSYLRSKFIKNFGMTITEYRDELRISAAKEMLRSDAFAVGDIADSLGYFDASHFSKFFTRKCGMTPRQYANAKKSI